MISIEHSTRTVVRNGRQRSFIFHNFHPCNTQNMPADYRNVFDKKLYYDDDDDDYSFPLSSRSPSPSPSSFVLSSVASSPPGPEPVFLSLSSSCIVKCWLVSVMIYTPVAVFC